MMGDKAVLLGMTFSLEKMKAEIAKQAMTYTVLCVILEALLIARVIFHLLIFLLRPLKDIQKSIRLYRDNKDSKAVIESLNKILKGHTSMIIRRNEIGTLARDVISLAKEMDEHTKRIQNITAEKERISTELSVATQIQAAMLARVFLPDDGFETIAYSGKPVAYLPCADSYFVNEKGSDDREEIKREFYELLSAITGVRPPWGTLTGVRPLKPALEICRTAVSTVRVSYTDQGRRA